MKMFVTGWNRIKGHSKKSDFDYDFYNVDGLVKRFDGEGTKLQCFVYSVSPQLWSDLLDKAPVPPFVCSFEECRGRVVDVSILKYDNIIKDITDGVSK